MNTNKILTSTHEKVPKKTIIVFFFLNTAFFLFSSYFGIINIRLGPFLSPFLYQTIFIAYLFILNQSYAKKGVSEGFIKQINFILKILFPLTFLLGLIITFSHQDLFASITLIFLPIVVNFIVYLFWIKNYQWVFKQTSIFEQKLMELIQTEKVIQINQLAISCNIQPLKAKKKLLKKIREGYIIGQFDEIKWELHVGKDAFQNSSENYRHQDNSSLNTTSPPNFRPTTSSPNPLQSSDPQQNISGLLALVVGDLGVHKFYMGDTTLGIIYLCLSWTFIPGILSFIEGIMILTESKTDFEKRLSNIRNK
ncbi:TM2 domain-containing protein [Promethearchaeum syntrophicum]|uniref:TM2 domain-containing protein n=1 Tax=Promethearchaeum syntrophicum TaxID=2594042 RepID=A0A5B9DDK3_9ARCH|nr:TM2 domain-containing protein [Candidatus Prometheoarchaeum syntrophicum]QEE17202.1 TM2 domain protein [Candidatus Prometheoarchaeum syntrophicum]